MPLLNPRFFNLDTVDIWGSDDSLLEGGKELSIAF